MSELSPSLARILAMLEAAKGEYVPGQDISKAIGIPMMTLSGFITNLHKARSDLRIVASFRAAGAAYRLVPAELPAEPPPEFEPPRKPKGGAGRSYRQPKGLPQQSPMHVRMAANMAVLDLIPAKAAEMIKVIALESGETTDETMLRLLSNGCEVHRDRVGAGENPLNLRAPRGDGKGEARNGR